eukprot:3946926-Alexandrium_andersonii.AAC.1
MRDGLMWVGVRVGVGWRVKRDLGIILTLVRGWEERLAANLTFQSRDWYSACYRYLDFLQASAHQLAASGIDPKSFVGWECHSIRADATNTAVARTSKAHTVEMSSIFRFPPDLAELVATERHQQQQQHQSRQLHGPDDDDDDSDALPSLPPVTSQYKVYAHIHPCPDSCPGPGARRAAVRA